MKFDLSPSAVVAEGYLSNKAQTVQVNRTKQHYILLPIKSLIRRDLQLNEMDKMGCIFRNRQMYFQGEIFLLRFETGFRMNNNINVHNDKYNLFHNFFISSS